MALAMMNTAMTAQTEVDQYVDEITKNLSHAANNEAENELERELLLECSKTIVEELTQYGQVAPNDTVAAFLAQHDSRFKIQTPIIINSSSSNEALQDLSALQQVENHRVQVHEMANALQSSRDAALTIAAEILHLEITAALQDKKTKKKKNINAAELEEKIPEDLLQAIQDMEQAIASARMNLEKWDPLPEHIRQLEDLLVQVNRGFTIGHSQTQDTIDKVTDRLIMQEKENNDQHNNKSDDEASPTQVWASLLRPY